MTRVEGNAILVAAPQRTRGEVAFFRLLLDAVMTFNANTLQIFRVEKQRFIAFVGFDVIANSGRNLTTGAGAEDAKGLTPELFEAESFPCCAVVKLNPWFHAAMIRGAMAFGLPGRQYRTILNNTDKK